MKTVLSTETLKSRETMVVECVVPPEPERAAEIAPFLGHKPAHYFRHVQLALEGRCDGLETRFYVGRIGEQMVGNIMTTEYRGAGVFGHVNTREDQRRKGICNAIMRNQMADFRARSGKLLLLGTGYQSPAYRIYESFGFRDWEGGRNGDMRYEAEDAPAYYAQMFQPAPAKLVSAGWRHWPLVALLAYTPVGVKMRCASLGVRDVKLLEGPYCKVMAECEAGRWEATVLESDTGAVTAIGLAKPDDCWPEIWNIDLLYHPVADAKALASLVEQLAGSRERVQCAVDPEDAPKIEAMEAAALRREAVLPHQGYTEGQWRDIWLYGRG